ncbi:MAG: GTPase ObgE [Planctomycetes bacterium]|nr:GTPase ObgE [Planctomycetota bacterium]
MFKDEIEIFVRAGKGGRGKVSFRREKFVPRGGPDGGDGGHGGSVVLEAKNDLDTLYHFTHTSRYLAEEGEGGGAANCTGRNGQDLVLYVPTGTIVRDRERQNVLKDLKKVGDRVVVARGGRGGKGNKFFASPTHQVPRRFQPGEKGEERWLELELRLIADVGIVGLPNAGKSTLLSRLSAARPKIADYPFTTLKPQLGILPGPEFHSCVLADLPGLIEGAHEGHGLGDQFLKHVERTRMLLHLVDACPLAPPAPVEAYRTVRAELAAYSATLGKRPELVVANKLDLPGSEEALKDLEAAVGQPVLAISAVTGRGLEELAREIFRRLAELPTDRASDESKVSRVQSLTSNGPTV